MSFDLIFSFIISNHRNYNCGTYEIEKKKKKLCQDQQI